MKNICQIKGIGMLTVAAVLAETNFELFKNYKQLVSYAGFDVVERESGISTGKTKISKKGNGHLRRAMFMPAFTAVRYKEKPLLDLFDRTFAKHGIKMESYVAVQKKLLVLIYHIWNKNEKFDPNYTLTKALLQEELNLFIEAELHQKNSPNRVEAIPDKQISFKEEVLSIS